MLGCFLLFVTLSLSSVLKLSIALATKNALILNILSTSNPTTLFTFYAPTFFPIYCTYLYVHAQMARLGLFAKILPTTLCHGVVQTHFS